MTARAERAITVTVDHRHPLRQQSGNDPPRFCLVMVTEPFPTVRRREPLELHPFGLVMRGMAGTLTVMAMEWGVNDVSATVPATHG